MMLQRPVRLAVFAVLAGLFFAGPSLVRYYTDWLWFGEVGYQQVFLTMLRAQGGLFTIAFAISAVWLTVNLRTALATVGDLRPVFTTREFFELAQSKLNDDGVLIANYYGSLRKDSRSMVFSVLKTMRAVFPRVHLIATVDPRSEALQNFIFVGHNTKNPAARMDLRGAAQVKFTDPMLNGLADLELLPSEEWMQSGYLLTDDFAPVEYHAASVIRQFDAVSRREK